MAGTVYERQQDQIHELERIKKMVDFRLALLTKGLTNEYLKPKTRQHMEDKLSLLDDIVVTIESILQILKDGGTVHDANALPELSRAFDLMEQEGAQDE